MLTKKNKLADISPRFCSLSKPVYALKIEQSKVKRHPLFNMHLGKALFSNRKLLCPQIFRSAIFWPLIPCNICIFTDDVKLNSIITRISQNDLFFLSLNVVFKLNFWAAQKLHMSELRKIANNCCKKACSFSKHQIISVRHCGQWR